MTLNISLLRRLHCGLLFVFLVLSCLMPAVRDTASAALPVQNLIANSSTSEVGTSVEELEASVVVEEQEDVVRKNSIANVQVMLEEFIQVLYWRLDILITANSAKVPHDIGQAMNRISQGNGTSGFARMLGMLGLVFALALAAEFLFHRLILLRFQIEIPKEDMPSLGQRLWALLLKSIPEFIALATFVAASYLFYVLIYADYFSGLCPLYISLLTIIIVARTLSIFSAALLSPGNNKLRLISLDDKTSMIGHRSIVFFAWMVVGAILCILLFEHAGLEGDSALILRFIFGSLCIFSVALFLIVYRGTITDWIQGNNTPETVHWFRDQMASKWLYMALGYVLLLWVVWVVQLVIVGPEFGFAYGVSLFVVPIFLLLDGILGWLLSTISEPEPEKPEGKDAEEALAPEEHVVFFYLRAFTRVALVVGIALGLMNLWGKGILFSKDTKEKGIEVFLILFVVYVLWQVINKAISAYLDNRAQIQAENAEDVDSEWGDSPLLDRGQTLLPLVRKFTGVIMVIMMILLILSTIGINIGPLLAGAGVVGIAIGFGAQKLVNDILSGFFYLLDDAFRVGEYIKTDSISGAVEKITLRNVMLRHHRGMLQIVPYSDLGAITNFMRGGIVVKFNLQFPYDTDVNQVRKVIKKVGIAMLNDPEFGKNFISQVKSQGIREVADSVLTIRVKFTAQPGTHFVIRREAYLRITEALAEKGIFYAHRKVIVEVPTSTDGNNQIMDEASRKKLAESGAAAHLANEASKNKQEG